MKPPFGGISPFFKPQTTKPSNHPKPSNQADLQAQLLRFPVHDLHKAHVAVAAHIGRAEDGRHLVLPRCHLVVLHRHGAADLQHLCLGNVQQLLGAGRCMFQNG